MTEEPHSYLNPSLEPRGPDGSLEREALEDRHLRLARIRRRVPGNGAVVGTKQIDMQDANVGESRRADHMLRDAGFRPDPQTELVLVQSTSYTASDRHFAPSSTT